MKINTFTLSLIAILFMCSTAKAVDFSSPILDNDDKPLTVPTCEAPTAACSVPVPITLRSLIVRVLEKGAPDETDARGNSTLSIAEKESRWALEQEVHKSQGDLKLSAGDLEKLKTLVGKVFASPMIVGRIKVLLDNNK